MCVGGNVSLGDHRRRRPGKCPDRIGCGLHPQGGKYLVWPSEGQPKAAATTMNCD